MTHTENISAVLGNLRLEDVPPGVTSMAQDLVLDWLANAAAGAHTPFGLAVSDVAGCYAGRGRAHLAASLSQVDPLTAALVNGGCSHSNEFDDSHALTLFHPGSPIISAALSIAEEKGASGRDFLAGLVAGYEFSLRLAACVNPSHYRMWHTTGTVGVFGAALAVGRTLNLEPRAIVNALGLAGTQSAGLWEVLPDAPSAKNLHPGRAAQGGVLAALLAKKGIEGPATILEGPRGFYRAMVPDSPKVAELVNDVGQRWRILEITIKAYPICGHAMTPVEAAMVLRKDVALEQLETITVFTNSTAIRVAGQYTPENVYQAKFSIPYCVAVALIYGRVTQREFTAEILSHAQVRSIMQKIELKVDEGFDRDFEHHRSARIEATVSQGQKVVAVAVNRRGGPENPLSDGEKREKFIRLSELAWGAEVAEEIWRRRDRLLDLDDMGTWLEGSQSKGPAGSKECSHAVGPLDRRGGREISADAIQIKEVDNVATALRDLVPDRETKIQINREEKRLSVIEPILFDHKFAVKDIAQGGHIIKYGEVIGRATKHIKAGTHAHVHNVESLRGRGDWKEEGQP